MSRGTPKRVLQCAVVSIFILGALWYPTLGRKRPHRPVQDRAETFQPNHAVRGGHYVGSEACAACHADKVKTQKATPMGTAFFFSKDSAILRGNPRLTFQEGPFSYHVNTSKGKTTFTVSDGKTTVSEPVEWAFGKGLAGQTYVFLHNGAYVEGRVSYYTGVKNLDITVGHSPAIPRSIEDALGRPMGADETRACFGCHTSRAAGPHDLQLDKITPGVTCESCHGPGEKHITAIKAAKLDEANIFNPGSLNTEDLSNFCGACHRTWEQVGLMGVRGVNNVRFQPYRLTNSKCYDADDRRISCVACHDPHQDLRQDAAYYDSKCTACHTSDAKAAQSGNRIAAVCKVGKQNCTSCHMARYDLPGGHYKFNDHDFRIIRPGDPYPD